MPRGRKKLERPESSHPENSWASFLAKQVEDPNSRIRSVKDLEGSWKYIDFCDPCTGLPSITQEFLVGSRGFKVGTVYQLRALWAKGKSSYCYLQYAAGYQKHKALCFHIETEGAGMPPDRVAEFGIHPSMVGTAIVHSFEECGAVVDDFICRVRGGFGGSIGESGRQRATIYTKDNAFDPEMKFPIMIGIDSISALDQQKNVVQDVIDLGKTGQISFMARGIRSWLGQRAGRFYDAQCCVFLTSHETKNIQTGMAARIPLPQDKQSTSKAGDAIGMYDSTLISFDSAKWRDDRTKMEIGSEIKLKMLKNKLGWQGRQISLFLTPHQGFDMIHSDYVFLTENPLSPLKALGGLYPEDKVQKVRGGVKCPLLSDRTYTEEIDFVGDFYENKDLVDDIRNRLFIRGYGLPWESKYESRFDSDGNIVREAADANNVYARDIKDGEVYDETPVPDDERPAEETEEEPDEE